jgi:hypothetical protein
LFCVLAFWPPPVPGVTISEVSAIASIVKQIAPETYKICDQTNMRAVMYFTAETAQLGHTSRYESFNYKNQAD